MPIEGELQRRRATSPPARCSPAIRCTFVCLRPPRRLAGRARPLRLVGVSGVVSRIHARVELDGWQVFISDLNSANGTYVVLPGETDGTKLAPGVRTPLVAGAQIRLGDAYALRYDSHRHR